MNTLTAIFLIMLDLTAVFSLLVLGYYSIRMLIMMRWGRFEKSWKTFAAGSFVLSIGFFFLTLEDFFPAYSLAYSFLDYAGTAVAILGILGLVAGMRQAYLVWRLKDIKPRGGKTSEIET